MDNKTFYGAGGHNNLSKEHKKAEIGFWLLTEFWGKGIMSESMPIICKYGFDKLGLHRIEGFVESENINCKKVLPKLGFKYEGTMRDCEIKKGKFISLDIYAKQNVKIPAVIPVIAVDDIKQGIAFYKQLGFREEKAFSFSDENGRLVHAHLAKGDSVIFLGLPDISYYKGNPRANRIEETKSTERGLGITLILQTDNLDKIYNVVKTAGLKILHEPTNEWYGDKVFLFLDPFGYEWKVSQPLT